jgi:cold shock CspA family protein
MQLRRTISNPPKRLRGIITYMNYTRGYAFITTKEGQSYFMHVSHFDKNSQPVLEGKVEFSVAPPISVGKKPMAVSVRYVSADDETATPHWDSLSGKAGV